MDHPFYSVHPTPIGQTLVVVTGAGLAHLRPIDGPVHLAVAEIVPILRDVPVEDAAATAEVTAQLDEYFAGVRRGFEVTLDLGSVRGFARAALEAICEIPYAETAAYGEVAIAAGAPRAARAVGTACARTPISIVVPVHRVIRADGSLGPYGGHPERKRALRELELRTAGEKTASRPGE